MEKVVALQGFKLQRYLPMLDLAISITTIPIASNCLKHACFFWNLLQRDTPCHISHSSILSDAFLGLPKLG